MTWQIGDQIIGKSNGGFAGYTREILDVRPYGYIWKSLFYEDLIGHSWTDDRDPFLTKDWDLHNEVEEHWRVGDLIAKKSHSGNDMWVREIVEVHSEGYVWNSITFPDLQNRSSWGCGERDPFLQKWDLYNEAEKLETTDISINLPAGTYTIKLPAGTWTLTRVKG